MNVVEQKASRSSVDSSDLSLIEDLGEAAGSTTSNGPMEQRSREFAKEVLKLKKLDTYILPSDYTSQFLQVDLCILFKYASTYWNSYLRFLTIVDLVVDLLTILAKHAGILTSISNDLFDHEVFLIIYVYLNSHNF